MTRPFAIFLMVSLNAVDAWATSTYLLPQEEANPIMRALWEQHLYAFFGFKAVMTLVCCTLVWSFWHRRYARRAATVGLLSLACVVVYQAVQFSA